MTSSGPARTNELPDVPQKPPGVLLRRCASGDGASLFSKPASLEKNFQDLHMLLDNRQ